MGIIRSFRKLALGHRTYASFGALSALLVLGLGAMPAHGISSHSATNAISHLLGIHRSVGPGDNWSGYEVTGQTFTEVQGNWNTQCHASGQPSYAANATWVGIGGEGNAALLQAGTVWHNGAYRIFTEYVIGNSGGPAIRSAALPCGQPIAAQVYKGTNPSAPWCVKVQAGSLDSVNWCGNWPPGQSTAEWMDDRPECVNPKQANMGQMADFRYTQFSNAFAFSNTGNHTILGYAHHAVQMHDANGAVMAAPDATSSATSFTDRWFHFDPGASSSCTV